MTFRVGQKVVSLRTFTQLHPGEVGPKKGCVYTVRGVDQDSARCGLYLYEIRNPEMQHVDGFCEPSWYARDFRPVVERKTDISIFTAMLNTSKQGVEA